MFIHDCMQVPSSSPIPSHPILRHLLDESVPLPGTVVLSSISLASIPCGSHRDSSCRAWRHRCGSQTYAFGLVTIVIVNLMIVAGRLLDRFYEMHSTTKDPLSLVMFGPLLRTIYWLPRADWQDGVYPTWHPTYGR